MCFMPVEYAMDVMIQKVKKSIKWNKIDYGWWETVILFTCQKKMLFLIVVDSIPYNNKFSSKLFNNVVMAEYVISKII